MNRADTIKPVICPYTPGSIGPGQARRTAQVETVYSHIRHTESSGCVLYGQRRIGKTSLLLQLRETLPAKGKIRTVFFDLQDKLDHSLAEILGVLAEEIIDVVGLKRERFKGPMSEKFFRSDFLSEVRTAVQDDRLVLLFDEFDAITPSSTMPAGALVEADPNPEDPLHDSAMVGADDARRRRHTRTLLASLERIMGECPWLYMVFVMGRYIEDGEEREQDPRLANADIVARFFRNLKRVSVTTLSREETFYIVELSETEGTLRWDTRAKQRVWEYTNGHPLLVQALCGHVWETQALHRSRVQTIATVEHVDAAIGPVLEDWGHAFDWLWGGLSPACKVITAALAQHSSPTITENDMFHILRVSGVRSIVDTLADAPRLLVQWDLIDKLDDGYCFRVELIRRWVRKHHPLGETTQKVLDEVKPVAESNYRTAVLLKRQGDLALALERVQAALDENPNHGRALALAARIHLEQGNFDETERLLQHLIALQPNLGRARLVEALVEKSEREPDPARRITIYDRILEIDRDLQSIYRQRIDCLRQCGEAAIERNALEEALTLFQQAGLDARAEEVRSTLHERAGHAVLEEALRLERHRKFSEAATLIESERANYRDFELQFTEAYSRIRPKIECDQLMQDATRHRERGLKVDAAECYLEVCRRDLEYPDVTHQLDLLVRGPAKVLSIDPEQRGAGSRVALAAVLGWATAAVLIALLAVSQDLASIGHLKDTATVQPPPAIASSEHEDTTNPGSECPETPAVACKDCLPSECTPGEPRKCPVCESTPSPVPKVLSCQEMRTHVLRTIKTRCREAIEIHSFERFVLKFKCTFRAGTDQIAQIQACRLGGTFETPVRSCVDQLNWPSRTSRFRPGGCENPLNFEMTKP